MESEVIVTAIVMVVIAAGLFLFITRDKGDSAPVGGEGDGHDDGRGGDSDLNQY